MVAGVAEAGGKEIPVQVMPRRDGDIAGMQANAARAHQELGWKASHDLSDMARSTWDWQSRNPNGYGSTDDG